MPASRPTLDVAGLEPASSLASVALGTSNGAIPTLGARFVDEHGRTLQLRGANVGGMSKLPAEPHMPSHIADGFFEHRQVSFVGRPFPLSEAPLHFARLQAWGLTLVRFLVTWEALAHDGPNEEDVDTDYIDYLRSLFTLMPRYGIRAFVCAHQDVWSRFCGGSGAPGWTFEAAGLDMTAFKATGAAYVHNLEGSDVDAAEAVDPDERGKKRRPEPSGPFVWPSGYQKLAGATMATLFWAGDVFAWQLKCRRRRAGQEEEVSIREYLQDAYMAAFGRLADELGGLEACAGFDVMNEPHRGFIELHDWHGWNYETDLHIGHYPSLLQMLALGSGHKQEVPFYIKSWPFPTRVSHQSVVDPKGKSAWTSGCVWRKHGVWEWDKAKGKPVALREDFFDRDPRPLASGGTNAEIEWYRDCWAPFVERFTERIRAKHPHLTIFTEPIPNEFHPPWPSQRALSVLSGDERKAIAEAAVEQDYSAKTHISTPRPENLVYAPHFYDLNVLFAKVHSTMSVNVQGLSRGMFILKALYFGFEGLCKNYLHQLQTLTRFARLSLGDVPVIIGEVGIPFDVNDGSALRDGDYSTHVQLLEALIRAMEATVAGYTLWNYNPANSVEHGDSWNKEDFSLMCSEASALDRDNHLADDELYHGGRALKAVIRPYAAKVAGTPYSSRWDASTLLFEFKWQNHAGETDEAPAARRRTEIYLPKYHYGRHELRVELTDGRWGVDRERQSLYVEHANTSPRVVHTLRISVKDPPPRPSGLSSLSFNDWVTLGGVGVALVAIVVAVLAIGGAAVRG